jgi:hypothetical protein
LQEARASLKTFLIRAITSSRLEVSVREDHGALRVRAGDEFKQPGEDANDSISNRHRRGR